MTPVRTVTRRRRAGRYFPPGPRQGGQCPRSRAPPVGAAAWPVGGSARPPGLGGSVPGRWLVPWGGRRRSPPRRPGTGKPRPGGARRHSRAAGGCGPHFLVRRQRPPPPRRARSHAGWGRGAAGGRLPVGAGGKVPARFPPEAALLGPRSLGRAQPRRPSAQGGRGALRARRERLQGRIAGKPRRLLCLPPLPRPRRARRSRPAAP